MKPKVAVGILIGLIVLIVLACVVIAFFDPLILVGCLLGILVAVFIIAAVYTSAIASEMEDE